MGGVTQSVAIRAPREHVFAVIADFARYPEFLPEIRGVTIERRGATEVVATFAAQIFTALTYTLRFQLRPPERIAWRWVRGQVMRNNEGDWRLRATPDGGTEAHYTIAIQFHPLVPRSVGATLVRQTLPATLRRFKERAERTYGPTKKRAGQPARKAC